jgi:hypothetical protein
VNEEKQGSEKSELDKAIGLLEECGYGVVPPFSLSAKPYIRELWDVLDAAGYRLDEAKVERKEIGGQATGRILLTLYPFKVLQKKEREGDA